MRIMPGMPYTAKQYRERAQLGEQSNTLFMLVAVCLVMFVGLQFMKAVWFFRFGKDIAPLRYYNDILRLFVLPADGGQLGSKPWTVLTHMFVHESFWKILPNMLWLWCFGYILKDLTGSKKIIPLFIYGSLAGGLAFILAYNLVPSLAANVSNATFAGASCGLMTVAVTTTLISPGYRIFPLIGGGLPLWILSALFIVSDLATVSVADTGVLIAHLAAALTGYLFIVCLRMGYDWTDWMNRLFDWFTNLFNPDKPRKNKTFREELFYKTTTAPYVKTPHVTQERIDSILDKIGQSGYSSLTDEERDLLKRAQNENF